MTKYASVFGGSELSRESPEYREAERLGEFLAQNDYVVKCGGYCGLMEAVSKGVKKAGGKCIGITNAAFDSKKCNGFISEERKSKDIFDRLRNLIDDSKLFIFQKGSLGTMEELCTVWCLAYTKTIVDVKICLIGEFWPDVIGGFRKMAIKSEEFNRLTVFLSMTDFVNNFK